jgi:Big-like domain-containing protein
MRRLFLNAPSMLLAVACLTLSLSPVSLRAQAECVNDFSEDFEPEPAPEWAVDTAVNLNSDSPNWTVSEDPAAHSPTHSFVSDASGLDLKDDRLIAPPVDLSRTSRLTFWHRFSFESGYDGGLLEVSTDGGNQWVNVVRVLGQFTEGGYNGVIDGESGSPIAHEPVWTGDSPDPGPMTRVAVDIGDPVGGGLYLLRWRLVLDPRADRSTPGGQWWIDDVHIADLGVDCPPDVADDFAMTGRDTPVSINVLANDRDPDGGEPIHLAEVTPPQHGEADIENASTVTYTPEAAFEGQDDFSYRVCDLDGMDCSTGRVFVTVGGEAQVLPDPRCSEPGLTVLVDTTGDALTTQPYHDIERISLTELPTLPSGRIMFLMKVVNLPAAPPSNMSWIIRFRNPIGSDRFVRMTTFQTGTPTFSSGVGTNTNPASNPGVPADVTSDFGTDGTIRIVVRRSAIGNPQPGQNLTSFLASAQIHGGTLDVSADTVPNDQVPAGSYEVIGNDNCVINFTPFAVDDSATAITGFPTRIDVLANDADADGDPLTATGVTDPPNGTATVNPDNTVTYRSTCGFSGFDTFTYTKRWSGRNGFCSRYGPGKEDLQKGFDLLRIFAGLRAVVAYTSQRAHVSLNHLWRDPILVAIKRSREFGCLLPGTLTLLLREAARPGPAGGAAIPENRPGEGSR